MGAHAHTRQHTHAGRACAQHTYTNARSYMHACMQHTHAIHGHVEKEFEEMHSFCDVLDRWLKMHCLLFLLWLSFALLGSNAPL